MITLPWPPASLSSNARGHWAKKASATKKYRADAMLCTMAAKPTVPAEGEIALTIRFVPPHNRIDRANMPGLLKAGLDGIADALGVNDRRFVPVFSYGEPEKPGRVVVEIGA